MDNTRTIEIDGFNVTIDTAKTGSWAAFKLLKKAREATDELEQFAALVELVEYATDATEDKVVKHLGGDSALPRCSKSLALWLRLLVSVTQKTKCACL